MEKAERARPKREKRAIPEFYQSKEWLALRYRALKKYGARCQCCGATPADGAVMNVDHIKARTKHPELALKLNNLQVLCSRCNQGKGWRDETDWRVSQNCTGCE